MTVNRDLVAPPGKLIQKVEDGAVYMLAKDKVYVTQTSERTHTWRYLEAMHLLKIEVDEGKISSKVEAKNFITRFFA